MNLREYIRTYLNSIDPKLDVRENSPYDELFIAPQEYLGETFFTSLVTLSASLSPDATTENFLSNGLDTLASRVFISRVPKARSYGLVRVYFATRNAIDLRSAEFYTSSGYTIYPEKKVLISEYELVDSESGYYTEFLGYCDDGVNIDADTISNANISGWVRLENDAFTGGSIGTSDEDLLDLYKNSYIYQDNFLYARSIINLIKSRYPDVKKVFVAGKGDLEMQRDVILSLDSINGTAGIINLLPNSQDVYFNYDMDIQTSDIENWLGNAANDIGGILSENELDVISVRDDNKKIAFVRGQLFELSEHVTFNIVSDGNENGEYGEIQTNTLTGVQTLTLASDPTNPSPNSMAVISNNDMPVTDEVVEIDLNLTINKLSNRYLYIGLTDIADIPNEYRYYKAMGLVVKLSNTPGEYNVFLVNKMPSEVGEIVLGDVSVNVGDNLANDSTSPAYTFGRPYLAATHLDIEEGDSFTWKLRLEHDAENGTYSLEWKDEEHTKGLNYNNITYNPMQSNYGRMFVSISNAKVDIDTGEDISFDVDISQFTVSIPASDTYYIAWQVGMKYPNVPGGSYDDYRKMVITIAGTPSVSGGEGIPGYIDEIYILTISKELNAPREVVKIDNVVPVSDGSNGYIYTLGNSSGYKDYISIDGYLYIVLASKYINIYDIDYINISLQKTGVHGGNALDVYVSAPPVLHIDTITVDNNDGHIPLGQLTHLPVLHVAYVRDNNDTTYTTDIRYSDKNNAEFYRFSNREGDYVYIDTEASSGTELTIGYYSNDYVGIIQNMADDDYYRDVLCDVLVRNTIPILISSVKFSTNIGFSDTPDAKVANAVVDYINSHPDTLSANELEQILQDNGASSVNITGITYNILYPTTQSGFINISPVPNTINSQELGNDIYDIYKRSKGFVAYSQSFTLEIE